MKRTLKSALFVAAIAASLSAQAQVLQNWMHSDVKAAWNQGYKGRGVTIQVIDDFRSNYGFEGNLGTGDTVRRHGEWTRLEASMIAPSAGVRAIDYNSTGAVRLAPGLNVLNLSYGMFMPDGYAAAQIGWSKLERSIISYAQYGNAVVAKAAGNDGVAVNAAAADGYADYLNRALVGSQAAIFVGALEKNGSTQAPAAMAWYSNTAGSDPKVQRNFLVVGVEGDKTGLYGTSFAAPIVTGYSAILGSKFRKATPTQIVNQLLNTARTDTVANYNPEVHGRGEASLSRALAPVSIR